MANLKEVVVARFAPFEAGPRACSLYGDMAGVSGRFGVDGMNGARAPWPLPGTFRNLRVDATALPGADTWPFVFYLNGLPTPLSVSLTGGTTSLTDAVNEVVVVPGDQVGIRADITDITTNFSWSWEFESQTPVASAYGTLVGSGNFGGGFTLASAVFGNNASGVATILGSIAGCAGTLTGLRVTGLQGPGLGETYTWNVRINGIIQDGTGGTVNTTLVQTGASGVESNASNTFSLPIVAGDLVAVVVARSAGANTGSLDLAYGISFDADIPGQFHTCGSLSNNVNTNPMYLWGGPTYAAEPDARGFVGPTGLVLRGMRIYGPDINYRLRFNETDPASQPNVTVVSGLGSDLNPTHFIAYGEGDALDIIAAGGSGGNPINYGFLSSIQVPPVPGLRLTQLPIEAAYEYGALQPFLNTAALRWATPPPSLD